MLYFVRTSVLLIDHNCCACIRGGKDPTRAGRSKHVGRGTGLYLPLSICFRTDYYAAETAATPGNLGRRGRSSVFFQRKIDAAAANGGAVACLGSRCPVQVPYSAGSPATHLTSR